MTPQERAEAHWNGYVGPLMEVMLKSMLDVCRFHYISSHVHGSKHGVEDVAVQENRPAEVAFDCVHYDIFTNKCKGEPFVDCYHCGEYKPRQAAKCPK